jgi:hypothetical protein
LIQALIGSPHSPGVVEVIPAAFAPHALPYVLPSDQQTGAYSIVHAMGSKADAIPNVDPQIKDARIKNFLFIKHKKRKIKQIQY